MKYKICFACKEPKEMTQFQWEITNIKKCNCCEDCQMAKLLKESLPFRNKFVYDSAEEYLKAYPEYLEYKHMLAKAKSHSNYISTDCVLLKSDQSCLPDDYLICWISSWEKEKWHVRLNDGDDGYLCKIFDSRIKAENCIKELKDLAPFSWNEIKEFGFKNE